MFRITTPWKVERFSCTAAVRRGVVGLSITTAVLLPGASYAQAAAPANAQVTINGQLVSGASPVKLGALPTLGGGLPAALHRIVTAQGDLDGNTNLKYAYLYINTTPITGTNDGGAMLAAYDYENQAFFLAQFACVQANDLNCWDIVPPGGSLLNDFGTARLDGYGTNGAGAALLTGGDARDYYSILAAKTGGTYDGSMVGEVSWGVSLQNWKEAAMTVWVIVVDKDGGTTTTNSCTGAAPADATLCVGDDVGLTASTPRTLAAVCGATKCEYTCNAGFTLQAGACVASGGQLTGFGLVESVGFLNLSPVGYDATSLSGTTTIESAGWVTFRSGSPAACTGQTVSDYGVLIQPGNTLCGYALSETLGWISFNEAGHTVTIDPVARTLSGDAVVETTGFLRF